MPVRGRTHIGRDQAACGGRAPATGRRVKLLVLHEVRASRGAAALRGKQNVIAVLALHLTRFQRARVASRPRFASPEAGRCDQQAAFAAAKRAADLAP
jgi:hypothetical protein